MCNKFRQIENCYRMIEMLYNNGDSALYSIHCGDKESFIDDAISDEITAIVKKHYKDKIEQLNKEL